MNSLRHSRRLSSTLFIVLVLCFTDIGLGKKAKPGILERAWKETKHLMCTTFSVECCQPPFIRIEKSVDILENKMKNNFYGQHLAAEIVLTAIDAHLKDDDPSKALVLSFHGWAGCGKTFLAELIALALYEKGAESSFVKLYMASYNFPSFKPDDIEYYKNNLQWQVERMVSSCPYSLFIFDEVDKTPPGVLDALIPFISHPSKALTGVDSKRSIFIFLSNTGASNITRITRDAWREGRRRDDLRFADYQDAVSKEAFNTPGNGLYRSGIIDKILVDFFVPFLPLERRHVIQCAKAEVIRASDRMDVHRDVDFEQVANDLTYWPPVEKLYSQTGCKRVESLVKYQLARRKFRDSDDENIVPDNIPRFTKATSQQRTELEHGEL